jgi:hypothetical protein
LKESRLREVVEDAGFKVDGWTSEAPSGN